MDKERILTEIRRCAAENGGVPPGRDRFADLTGISQSYWTGTYWTTYSDALAEAGYSANRWNQPLDEEHLLTRLALLTRDLGHFPTNAERKLRRQQDKTFPSHNTFARFGNRQALISQLADFASARADLNDVVAICTPLVEARAVEADPTDPDDLGTDGFVYLVKSGKYYKIGCSNNVGRRSYELALQLPEPVTRVHEISTDDPYGIERYWHDRFADKRVNGEWFRLNSQDVKAFKRRRTFM
jgi:hypothetical protein